MKTERLPDVEQLRPSFNFVGSEQAHFAKEHYSLSNCMLSSLMRSVSAREVRQRHSRYRQVRALKMLEGNNG